MSTIRALQGVIAIRPRPPGDAIHPLRGAIAIVAPSCEKIYPPHKMRAPLGCQCYDFFMSCVLTVAFYFFVFAFLCFPLVVQCEPDPRVRQAED